MVSSARKWVLFLAVGALMFGCAAKQPVNPFTAGTVDTTNYVQKADNYVVVFDASQSMWYPYMEQQKVALARQFVASMNQTLPADLKLTGAMRTFGHENSFSTKPTMLLWGPAAHSTDALGGAVGKVKKVGGSTPLSAALAASKAEEMASLSGTTAMIVVSDGEATGDDPVAAAKDLKAQFGDKLCIYTVQIGEEPGGGETLRMVADAGGCGTFSKASDLTSAAAMGNWVREVFYKEKPVAMVKDSDGDGIPDDRDKCPNTPKGSKVDADGCWVLDIVLFDFDKTAIKAAFTSMLENVASILKVNPNVNMKLAGHTDSRGSAKYNMGLSQRRVDSVKTYLVNEGAAAGQIETEAYGESKPKASNDTADGRAMNRRVELVPSIR